MKILILFSQPWKVGGAETHVEALIRGLVEHKIVLAVNRGSDFDKLRSLKEKCNNIEKIIEIQSRGINIFRWATDIAKLAKIILEDEIEVISAHQRTSGLWAYLLKLLTDAPFIVTMHDAWHRAFLKKLYAKLFPTVIIVGTHLYDNLLKNFEFTPSQLKLINNGIDIHAFQAEDRVAKRQLLGLPQDKEIILHVSRLSRIKGAVALALIEAMEILAPKRSNSKLFIIGEGPLRSKIEAKAASLNARYGDFVEICNFTTQIADWYNAANIVIGEGRIAIEALACERPVVAIRNGEYFFGVVNSQNIAEAVALNFDGKQYFVSPVKLADEIEKAFSVDEIDISKTALFIRQHLSLENMAKKYDECLAEIVRE